MSNRLSMENSPYLLQLAENPVDWRLWRQEVFEEAKHSDKPIFLSIGYSTCHWCHVMAHEPFEDDTVAQVINAAFLPIKVDREERPDVDAVYMAACVAMNGSGGWPLGKTLPPVGLGTQFRAWEPSPSDRSISSGAASPPDGESEPSGFGPPSSGIGNLNRTCAMRRAEALIRLSRVASGFTLTGIGRW